jgi:hypothetical protein
MISNERLSPNRRPYQKPYQQPYQGQHQPYGYQQPRPQVQEDTLKTIDFEVERKSFRLTLKENSRGRFLRVTESNGNKFNSIVVPASGLADFKQMIKELVAGAGDVQANNEPEPTPIPEVPIAAPVAQIQVAALPEPQPEPALVEKTKATQSKPATKVKVVQKEAKKVVKVRVAKAAKDAI